MKQSANPKEQISKEQINQFKDWSRGDLIEELLFERDVNMTVIRVLQANLSQEAKLLAILKAIYGEDAEL